MDRGLQAAAAASVGGGISTRTVLPQKSSMDCEFAQLSDVGRVRQGNEDYLGCFAPADPEDARARGYLFAVADGVGGHDLGEVASHTAVESILGGFRECTPGAPHGALLTRLVRNANTCVIDAAHAAKSPGAGMATTIVACALRYDRAAVAHVGDSRCYLIRRGQPNLLTRDHTVANEHVRLKLLSKEEAAQAETRHMLSRSLGSELMVNVEVNEHQVFAGDVLLLCSDGLHGSVEASEMAALTSHGGDLAAAAKRLVDLANQRDGSDNISLQLIRVRSVERVGMYRGRPYRLP
jgi:serine/threonine protein phosphatase PrpC